MMADRLVDNQYEDARESGLYVIPDIQGYLERKKGVLGGKTKQFCRLQGSTLFLQKKQEVMETFNVKDIQQVRKVNSDYTGTQFEIFLKKKSHIFICQTKENCSDWVKSLQSAMVRLNMSQQDDINMTTAISSTSASMEEDANVYNEVDETLIAAADKKEGQSKNFQPVVVKLSSEYSEPCDKKVSEIRKPGDYYEVQIVPSQPQTSQPAGTYSQSYDIINVSSTLHSTDQSNNEPEVKVDKYPAVADEYTKVQKKKLVSQEVTQADVVSPNDEQDTSQEVVCRGDSSLSPEGTRLTSTSPESGDLASFLTNSHPQEQESGDNLFQVLTNALTDRSSPVQDSIHVLSEEDTAPLVELSQFLQTHQEICQISSSGIPQSNDPVSNLKSYLASLEIPFK